MKLDEFVKKYNGVKVDYDGYGGCQCVDLYRKYSDEVDGVPQSPALGKDGGAKDLINKPGAYAVTLESPTVDYASGDILVWGATAKNKYGHVAILVSVFNASNFIVFEQDGFKQDGAKFNLRSRENLLGRLRKA